MYDEQQDRWESRGEGTPERSPDPPSFYEEEESEGEAPEEPDHEDLFLTPGTWLEAAEILKAALSDPRLAARAMRLQSRFIEDLNTFAEELEIPAIYGD